MDGSSGSSSSSDNGFSVTDQLSYVVFKGLVGNVGETLGVSGLL